MFTFGAVLGGMCLWSGHRSDRVRKRERAVKKRLHSNAGGLNVDVASRNFNSKLRRGDSNLVASGWGRKGEKLNHHHPNMAYAPDNMHVTGKVQHAGRYMQFLWAMTSHPNFLSTDYDHITLKRDQHG